MKQIQLADGYLLEIGGNTEEKGKAVESLLKYAPLIAILMVATLVLAFRSIPLAMIIGLVALLSVGFGLLALWLTSFPLGFNPIIGTAGLIGIALNDTIVVLAALHKNEQLDIEKIVHEVVDCTRHILSTTLTTVGGFLPLLILTGGTFWPPLAMVIIGGVIGATTLSLIFTPCCYYLGQKAR